MPPVSIAGFEVELTEEFFRAVATNAKLTLHLSNPYGSNAHHMIEACFKAFARALAGCGGDRPRGAGNPLNQRDSDLLKRHSGVVNPRVTGRNFALPDVLTLHEMRLGSIRPRGRRIAVPATAVGTLCACLAAIGLLATAATADAKVPAEFFGIDAELEDSADYPDMQDAGFGSFRVAVNWAAAQPTADGPYNWTEADARIYDAAANGMTPVVGVSGSPGFVHAPSDKGNYAPTSAEDLQEWQDFNQALAERYGPGGDFYVLHPELAGLPSTPGSCGTSRTRRTTGLRRWTRGATPSC